MTTLAERVGAVEDKVDRLDRLEAFIDRYEEEGARERAEAARRREEAARQRAADREKLERQIAADREEERQRQERFEQFFEQYMEEAARERREMNSRWGEATDRIGRFVEDIVAPSVHRMAQDVFECGNQIEFSVQAKRYRDGDRARQREFDVVYAGTDKLLVAETKSTPRDKDVERFAQLLRDGELDLYFPRYRDLPVVPAFASLHIPDALVNRLTGHGIYALAIGDEIMGVLNLDAVRRRRRRAP